MHLGPQKPEVPIKATFMPKTKAIKNRRGKAAMQAIRDAIYATLQELNPMTVRQTFYRLTTQGVIEKTEAEYKTTIIRLLVEMRLDGTIPFGWISDNTRWMRKPQTFSSAQQALHYCAQHYRRSLWENQDVYVEVWTEKDALAGVLLEQTAVWDVPLMVSRGFSSITYLHEAAEAIAAKGKPAYLYYFGDHDPSGVVIDRKIEQRLREFAPDAELHFERVAVRLEQIEEWNLPTRPTKKTDSRSRNFEGESVEVDAIDPPLLQQLVRDCIKQHVDERQLNILEVAEESERSLLIDFANHAASA